MKAKSMKLRFLVTLSVLFKHTDQNHRMNRTKLNEYLKPYGLECSTGRSLNDTLSVLRDYGLDVRFTGAWENQGFWIEDRPLQGKTLQALVFAVSSNPYLSNEQATEILSSLRPFVTVFQESMLQSNIETGAIEKGVQNIFTRYSTVSEAIRLGRRVQYTLSRVRYDKETGEVFEAKEWSTLFTPKCLYQTHQKVYMVGYNHPDKRIEAIDLEGVADVKFSFKHKDPNHEKVRELLGKIEPRDYIPEERRQLIYKGPVIFRCRGQYVEELYSRFGQPEGPIEKDYRSRAVYRVSEAEIWPETLLWLGNVPGHGIRIVGPEELVGAMRAYYENTFSGLTDPALPACPPKDIYA